MINWAARILRPAVCKGLQPREDSVSVRDPEARRRRRILLVRPECVRAAGAARAVEPAEGDWPYKARRPDAVNADLWQRDAWAGTPAARDVFNARGRRPTTL